jgi:hypothetical protein
MSVHLYIVWFCARYLYNTGEEQSRKRKITRKSKKDLLNFQSISVYLEVKNKLVMPIKTGILRK